MKIAIIPIDNRPICYDLIEDVLSIKTDIQFFLPKISDLGGLTTSSNVDNLFDFIENLDKVDSLIVCLDTLAYGGLVSSRRSLDSFNEIKERVLKFREIASKKCKKILAFSSIMRISNNNINEEEKEYWSDFGKKIFDWSYNSHKNNSNSLPLDVPKEIINDYLETRKRNFEINKLYLELASENFFDTLIFSKDDCAQFGLNIKEASEIQDLIEEKKLKNVFVKTGADEIPLALISRAIVGDKKIKINPIFIEKKSTNLISKYEDISIENCVKSQLFIANLEIAKDSDLNFLINNFKKEQGDLVLGDKINEIQKEINFLDSPYFIADVNNANGADCGFVNQLFKQKTANFFGYCAYNTSANTIGCSILIALVKFLALKENKYNDIAFKKINFIRFLDDWAYQAKVRKFVRESAIDFKKALLEKEEELNKFSFEISKFLDFYPNKITYSLPWDRSFEIRIKLN